MTVIKGALGKIIVDKRIKPLPLKDRVTPELIIGERYYVSFGAPHAYPCTLTAIIERPGLTEVLIEKKMKINGRITTEDNQLRPYEIGITPEDAIRNQV